MPHYLSLLITLLILSACLVESSSTTPPITGPSGPHFLLAGAEPVALRRDGWPAYLPASFGTLLRATDLVQVETEASVLCAGEELQVKTLLSGEQSVPCPAQPGILTYKEAKFRARRVGTASANTIPFTLYPRNTLLLTDRPTLYWHETGASSYTVALKQGVQVVWQEDDVLAPPLPYPANQPPLEPNKDYRLLVTDNDSQITSQQDEPAGTGFRLASADERDEIEAGREQIIAVTGLAGADLDFILGVYFAGQEISSQSGFSPLGQAWLHFDKLAQTHPTPVIQLWYGDILNQLKLPDQAIVETYQAALAQAETLGDLESQGRAFVRLWCITGTATHIDAALKIYETLNDQAQLASLQTKDRPTIC